MAQPICSNLFWTPIGTLWSQLMDPPPRLHHSSALRSQGTSSILLPRLSLLHPPLLRPKVNPVKRRLTKSMTRQKLRWIACTLMRLVCPINILPWFSTHIPLASSTQQKQALSQYWTGVLQQKSSDLNTFVSTIRGAPILLPFDATNESLANLLTNPSTSPFPPPLACYPGLSSDQLQKINSIETSIFGLPPAQAQTTFDTSCFASRPIYGTLNILQLRLPFLDGRQGAAKQAAVLEPDAYSRAIIYSGEVLSAMPGSSSPNPPVSDPRQYGTLNNLNHVLLQYLKSISDVNDAIALVEFVLGQTPPIVPPGDTTLLYTALSSLPSLEIAILGSVGPSDISSTVSSFSDLSGKLFFGSTDSLDLRTWTINTNQAPHTVAWAELATSPEVVRDDSLTDDTFNTIWNSSFTFFHTNNTANVQVSNITTGFQALGLFNP